MIENFLNYQLEFLKQAKDPPGKDPYIAAIYQAVLLLLRREDSDFAHFINSTLSERKITPKHFVNLFVRAVQYLELFVIKNKNYPAHYLSARSWVREINYILQNFKDQFYQLLIKNYTVTNLYQRYAGLKAVSLTMFPPRGLSIVDLGCGGNLGLAGLSLLEPFKSIDDQTPGQFINKLVSLPIKLYGLGVDKAGKDISDFQNWLTACSFYPSELEELDEFILFQNRALKAKNINFRSWDYLQLDKTCPEFSSVFDVVHFGTTLYQLSPADRGKAFDIAKDLVANTGIIVIQDFAQKKPHDGKKLDFDQNWFKKPFTYRTFVTASSWDWNLKEFIQWSNGRCREVKPGEDYLFVVCAKSAIVGQISS